MDYPLFTTEDELVLNGVGRWHRARPKYRYKIDDDVMYEYRHIRDGIWGLYAITSLDESRARITDNLRH